MAKEYFSDLNYSLANEDTRIEYDLMNEGSERVFCIAGSGSRVLPLLAKNPREVVVVDMAQPQLYMCELRHAAVKALTYEEWLYFMGYRGALQGGLVGHENRSVLFEDLELSDECRAYWQDRRDGWRRAGFIYRGRWESHFLKLGSIFRDYMRCDFTPIFEANDLTEQIERWEKNWPALRLNTFLRVAASEYVFNKFLYKGHFAGSEGHRTETRPPYQFIREEWERLFKTHLARKSYFLQMMFLGRVRYEEGLPLEAHREIFERVKVSKTQVTYRVGNQLSVLPEFPWSFVSLSDTVSYLTPEDAKALLPSIRPTTGGCTTVIRSFMRAPAQMSGPGWQALEDKQQWAWHNDLTGVYQFHIYRN